MKNQAQEKEFLDDSKNESDKLVIAEFESKLQAKQMMLDQANEQNSQISERLRQAILEKVQLIDKLEVEQSLRGPIILDKLLKKGTNPTMNLV
jgi:hypothetical protein